MFELRIDFDEIAAFADDLARAGPLFEQEQRSTVHRNLNRLEQSVVPNTPVASGEAAGSWGISVKGRRHVMGELANAAPHGYYVEHGRAPGRWPPISAIEAWVRRKAGASGEEARSVAFLIARAIGTRGTKPGAQMLEDAWQRYETIMIHDLEGIPERVLARLAA